MTTVGSKPTNRPDDARGLSLDLPDGIILHLLRGDTPNAAATRKE
jgi:hypothetical protein